MRNRSRQRSAGCSASLRIRWPRQPRRRCSIDQLRRSNGALVEANAELERQYGAVLQARRLKDEFLANISHELRTPLTAVLGYISILQEGISGPLTDGQRHDLTHVKRASERLLDLIESLIELTTLKRGELDVFIEEVDPRSPLARSCRIRTGAGAWRHDATR